MCLRKNKFLQCQSKVEISASLLAMGSKKVKEDADNNITGDSFGVYKRGSHSVCLTLRAINRLRIALFLPGQ